jgi:hypothetical protein
MKHYQRSRKLFFLAIVFSDAFNFSILGVSCHFQKYFGHSQTCCNDHICEFEPSSWQGEVDTTLSDKVCQ